MDEMVGFAWSDLYFEDFGGQAYIFEDFLCPGVTRSKFFQIFRVQVFAGVNQFVPQGEEMFFDNREQALLLRFGQASSCGDEFGWDAKRVPGSGERYGAGEFCLADAAVVAKESDVLHALASAWNEGGHFVNHIS